MFCFVLLSALSIRLAAVVLLPGLLLLLAASSVTPSDYTGPLFDAHSHVAARIPVEQLISLLREAGLSGVFLFGPTDHTLGAQRQNPDFVFPFADVPRDRQTRQLLLNEDTLLLLLIRQQLDTGVMRGIGEIPWRHAPNPEDGYPADGPLALQIYDLAASYKVPVTVHVEHEYRAELERALEHNRNAIIIWAHAGDARPSLVGDLMREHPNLYADISARNPFFQRRLPPDEQALTNEDGSLKDSWRSVFEEFPNRFLFGLDLGGRTDRHLLLDQLVEYYRSVLGQLTAETGEKIAYRNAETLLNVTGE